MSEIEEVSEFRRALTDYVGEGELAILDDAEWWERFGEALDVVLAARARRKRAERELVRCPARYQGIARCVRNVNHGGDHYSPATGHWKNEA